MEIKSASFLQLKLSHELNRRKSQNRSYSLRAFASFLELSPAYLSLLLAGRRSLSPEKALKISKKLMLSPQELQEILVGEVTTSREVLARELINEDKFKSIADWLHYAILTLSKVRNNLADPIWIARRLNAKREDVSAAFLRLQKLGLVEIHRGAIRQSALRTTTTDDVPSAAIRRYHEGILIKAQEALHEVGVESREFGSQMLAVRRRDLPAIKDWLRQKQDEFTRQFESQAGDEVFQLSMQFFPMTKETGHDV